MIKLKEVKKYFGNIKAVDGISFEAKPGEIMGLIGPNGAGKSTTIRMIMNILAPDSGEICFNDKPLGEEHKSQIGYLPEERGFYKKVKVFEILEYFASLKSNDKQGYRQKIEDWLERFDLQTWKNRKVEELSKGMAQKVQFIAAIAHDPEIIFLDEPFSGLDPLSSDILLKAILELGAKGKTILFSTHVMEHAEKICSNIFLINKGKEVLAGSLKEIKTKFGSQSVIVEFDGNGDFIKYLKQVNKIIQYPRYVEIKLKENNPDDLLKELIGRISIKRFEVVAPSLHSIFIDAVKEE